MKEKVRRVVERGLRRSVCIARESRPRDLGGERGLKRTWEELGRLSEVKGTKPSGHERLLEEKAPPWGIISHAGWSSPSSVDLPNLQFMPVVLELPNLIEAKAVSLAPLSAAVGDEGKDITSTASQANTPNSVQSLEISQLLPDPLAVEILQRPSTMGVRDYLSYLSTLGLISTKVMSQFLVLYEIARFSSAPLSEASFRQLMSLFATLLRGMEKLDDDAFAEAYAAAAAAASEENSEGVSLYSTTSRSSSTRSFITSGDAPRHSMVIAFNDGSHSVGDKASVRTTSTVAHHQPRPSSSSSSSQRRRTKRPQLQSYITDSSYQSARPGLRTPSISSLGSVVVGDEGSIHLRSNSSLDTWASTDLGSVIRLSEEGGGILDLPVGEEGYETMNDREELARNYGDDDDDVDARRI